MVATARTIKQEHPDAKVVFIGPVRVKEAGGVQEGLSAATWTFVVTFEELQAMFDAKEHRPYEI